MLNNKNTRENFPRRSSTFRFPFRRKSNSVIRCHPWSCMERKLKRVPPSRQRRQRDDGVGVAPRPRPVSGVGGAGHLHEARDGPRRGAKGEAHLLQVREGCARAVGVQAKKNRLKLKAALQFSVSKLEIRCFQARVKLALPHRAPRRGPLHRAHRAVGVHVDI